MGCVKGTCIATFHIYRRDRRTGKRERTKIETLPVAEFLQRYLQHVPPSGYQTVRHYGLYTSAKKSAYERCADLLDDRMPPASSEETSDESALDSEFWVANHTCPVCGKPLSVTSYIPSSLTGYVVKRPPLGPVIVHSQSPGGLHAS